MAETTAYSPVSVKKKSSNQGKPESKKNIVIIFDFDKFKMERDAKNVKVTKLEAIDTTSKPIGLFVNEKTIDAGDEVEGDAYERGFLHHFNFQHPGGDLEFTEFKAANVNANLGAISIPCDGSTTAKVYGTPCGPLKMQKADLVDTSEANRQEVELKSEVRTEPAGIIDISKIPATDDDEVNKFLGLSVQGS